MYKALPKSQKFLNRRLSIVLFSLFLASTFLLSSCSGDGLVRANASSQKAIPTSTPMPTPTIGPMLQQQGSMQLETFQQWISLMKQYGGNTAHYQQQYTSDQQALSSATSLTAYQAALHTLNEQVLSIKLPALQAEATGLQQKLSQQANDWANKHTYYDSYNGTTYNLGYEYQAIVNYPTQGEMDSSQTVAAYQYAIGQLSNSLANFHAYQTDFSDKTPYNQIHRTDTQLLQKYGYTSGNVIVVSLAEQAMRVYQDNKLVNSFQVVTGMPDHPSLPGTWWIENRQTNIKFTSGKKPGQEGYYPPTPIAYALQYHSDGYFIHQSWWRTMYGPDMQFPHMDPGGSSFAYQGSHGCVNMSTPDVQWVYNFATVDTTKLVVY
ncbi:MAG: L,D-transpeptidase [Ktedonobacteraceae bacterium]|nr:L,D-transpeptidase [Ktedonobacteraceae bacterium]